MTLQELLDSDAQSLIDLIAQGLDTSGRYSEMLKNKFGIQFEDTDELKIEKANLSNILQKQEFNTFESYKRYCQKIFRLRNIPDLKQPNRIFTFEEILPNLMDIGVSVLKTSRWSPNHAGASGNEINLPSKFGLYALTHELGHVVDFRTPDSKLRYAKNMAYTFTSYGLSDAGECFAENFSYWCMYPNKLKRYLPEVYTELTAVVTPNIKTFVKRL